jgi:hypothetical protein
LRCRSPDHISLSLSLARSVFPCLTSILQL